jgi:hypothetical protein
METLTLEHLSAYLPYGLMAVDEYGQARIIDYECQSYTKTIVGLNHVLKSQTVQVNCFKPILYPLSSLTETIWYEGKEINPIEFIKDWYNEKYATEIDDLEYYALENEFALFGAVHETLQSEAEIIAMPYQAYQLLFKMKIDIFGLIEKGLAVDVNTLETNPYK